MICRNDFIRQDDPLRINAKEWENHLHVKCNQRSSDQSAGLPLIIAPEHEMDCREFAYVMKAVESAGGRTGRGEKSEKCQVSSERLNQIRHSCKNIPMKR